MVSLGFEPIGLRALTNPQRMGVARQSGGKYCSACVLDDINADGAEYLIKCIKSGIQNLP